MVTSRRTRRWGVVVAMAATVALLAPASPAAAAQTSCVVGELARRPSDFGPEQIAVERFDPSLGALRAVAVERTVASDQETRVENRDPRPQRVRLRSMVKVTMTSPAFTGSLPDISTTSEVGPLLLGAFDGVLDHAGKSGRAGLAASAPVRTSTATSTDADTLDGFTGDGTVTFVVRADGEGSFSGPGNATFETTTYASARVRVCYTYGDAAAARSEQRVQPASFSPIPPSESSSDDETTLALVLLSAGTIVMLVGSGLGRPRPTD